MELLGKLAHRHLIVLRSGKIRISNRIRHLDERLVSCMGQNGESGELLNQISVKAGLFTAAQALERPTPLRLNFNGMAPITPAAPIIFKNFLRSIRMYPLVSISG